MMMLKENHREIKILSDATINKIAAGEVVERPASVVKELVENSIDAGATQIDILLERAGKNLIKIVDNGFGMTRNEIEMAIKRHATSKLDEDDLLNINSFGFRGEALPSIAAISKFSISSRKRGEDLGYGLTITGGVIGEVVPVALSPGTVIEVRDLFFSTPARLKFLRSDKTELMAITALVKKIAIAHPEISISLVHEGKELIKVRKKGDDWQSSLAERIKEVMVLDFMDNAAAVNFQRDGVDLYGYVSIPTFNRAAQEDQFLFINNRPVKDKILNIALKVAYQDFLAKHRHPVAVLFIKIDSHFVDVNVHPAKTEVRFHDPNLIKSVVVSGVKGALTAGGNRVSSTLASDAIRYMQQSLPQVSRSLSEKDTATSKNWTLPSNNYQPVSSAYRSSAGHSVALRPDYLLAAQNQAVDVFDQGSFSTSEANPLAYGSYEAQAVLDDPAPDNIHSSWVLLEQMANPLVQDEYGYLGQAKTQLHKAYIISQSEDSVVIVDQHAAHERIGYERLKKQLETTGIMRQRLLIPEIVELDVDKAQVLFDSKDSLAKMGLTIDKFGSNSIIVSEIPALLGEIDVLGLINDLADHLLSIDESIALTELIEHVTETYACHYAIRSGKVLSILEMNELLRQMEQTEFSAQCNHGRPTYVELKIKDIEKLFGRR